MWNKCLSLHTIYGKDWKSHRVLWSSSHFYPLYWLLSKGSKTEYPTSCGFPSHWCLQIHHSWWQTGNHIIQHVFSDFRPCEYQNRCWLWFAAEKVVGLYATLWFQSQCCAKHALNRWPAVLLKYSNHMWLLHPNAVLVDDQFFFFGISWLSFYSHLCNLCFIFICHLWHNFILFLTVDSPRSSNSLLECYLAQGGWRTC